MKTFIIAGYHGLLRLNYPLCHRCQFVKFTRSRGFGILAYIAAALYLSGSDLLNSVNHAVSSKPRISIPVPLTRYEPRFCFGK